MEVNLSHILVNTEEEALNIKKMIEEEGKSFEDMAAEYSQCPSKEEKGNLGYYEKGRLFPEIEKIAFSAKRGKISEPVQTKEGWHIVKVNNIKYYSARENFQK
jgi:peptidyl-prolyl cis-trans isomerase C